MLQNKSLMDFSNTGWRHKRFKKFMTIVAFHYQRW